jgi:transposase-like protein
MTEHDDIFITRSPAVVEAVRAGSSLADAARHAGVAPRTVDRWLQKGREDAHGRYGSFAAKVDAARQLQGVPGATEAEVMSRRELRGLVATAARNGSVSAMKLADQMIEDRPERQPDQIDRIRARRRRRLIGAGRQDPYPDEVPPGGWDAAS